MGCWLGWSYVPIDELSGAGVASLAVGDGGRPVGGRSAGGWSGYQVTAGQIMDFVRCRSTKRRPQCRGSARAATRANAVVPAAHRWVVAGRRAMRMV